MGVSAVFPLLFQVSTQAAETTADAFFKRMNNRAKKFGVKYNEAADEFARSSIRTGRLGGLSVGLIGAAARRAGIAVTGLGVGIMTSMAEGVEQAGNFQVGMVKLSAVTEGNTDDMAALRKSALDTGMSTVFSAGEASDALLALAQAGFDAKEANAALGPTLDFVGASMGTLSTEQGALMAVLARRTLNLKEKELPGFFDQLTVATQKSNLNFEDLNGLFARIAETGVTMSNTTIGAFLAIAAAGKNAGKTNKEVGQSIRGIALGYAGLNKEVLGISASPTKTNTLAKLGMSPDDLKDSKGNWKDVLSITAQMTRQQQKLGINQTDFVTIMGTLFQKNAGGLLALAQNMGEMTFDGKVLKGVDALEALGKQIDAAGTDGVNQAAEAAAKYAESWEGLKKQLKNVWNVFQVVLGDTILPMLSSGLEVILAWGRAITAVAKESGAFRVAIIATVFSVGLFITGLGILITTVGILAVGFGFVAGVLAIYDFIAGLAAAHTFALSAAMLNLEVVMSPIILVALPFMLKALILLIPLLMFAGAALYVWQNNIGGFSDIATKNFGLVSNAAKVLFMALNGEKIPLKMGEMLLNETPLLGKFVVGIMNLKHRLTQLWEGFKDGLGPSLEAIVPQMRILGNMFKLAAKIVLGFFNISSEGLGKSADWRQFGNILGTLVGILIEFGSWVAIALGTVGVLGAGLIRVFGEVSSFLWDVMEGFLRSLTFVPRAIWAAFTDGFAGVKDVFRGHLQHFTDMLTFSEPKDTSSPLTNLGAAGAGMLGNIAAGMLGFAPTFGALVASALATAVTPGVGNPALSAVVASAPAAAGAQAAAASSSGGISVQIGQMVFQAAELSPAEAQKFARMVADNIATELAVQMSSSVA